MRAEVIRAFRDLKCDSKLRKEGDTFDAAPARIEELAEKGFVKPLEDEQPDPQPEVEEEPKPKKAKAGKKSAKKK